MIFRSLGLKQTDREREEEINVLKPAISILLKALLEGINFKKDFSCYIMLMLINVVYISIDKRILKNVS